MDFTSVDQLIVHLREESGKPERFATRFILVQGCQAWDDLVRKVTYQVDRLVPLSAFCSGPDVFPDMTRVLAYLKHEVPVGCSALLVPLAECVRLNPESADMIRYLAEWPAERIRRLYVPLLAAEEFFFSEIGRVSRYRQGLLPDIWCLRGEGNAEIIVAPFPAESVERPLAKGIKDYLSGWERASLRKVWLLTALAAWLPERPVWSECRVRVYPSSFDYVRRHVDAEELRVEWGSPNDWDWLAIQVREGDRLDQVAARLLNVAGYDAEHLFTLWPSLDERRRWLVWLWSKARSSPSTYLHEVLARSRCLEDFGHSAVMTILGLPRSVSVSRERKALLGHLGVKTMPAEFWERYGDLVDPLDRIAVLTGMSPAERGQLVLCVGELLTGYAPELWWEYLEVAFPELTWYLHPVLTGDQFVDAYFAAYNRCRLKDQPDQDLASLVTTWASQQLLWGYPTRSSLLEQQRDMGAKVLWVDAMGLEWTGLLTQLLTTRARVECEVKIARAKLPTLTEPNKEWEVGTDVVMRGLDDIAHHYAYQFPQSFLKAVDFIEDVALKVQELVAQYPAVVITSDHGLSRFAATCQERVEVPEGARVDERGGRFAYLPQDVFDYSIPEMSVVEGGAVYLLNHKRFRGSSGSPGEVHGGATPEECLTPVIILRRMDAEAQPRFELVTDKVRLNARGEGLLYVRSSRMVPSVELRVAGRAIKGQKTAPLTWSFHLVGWKAGKYTAKLYAASQPVGEITFEAVKGILKDDLGLGR